MAVNKNNLPKVNHTGTTRYLARLIPGICYLCCCPLQRTDLFICTDCNNGMPENNPACPHCAMPVVNTNTLCGACLSENWGLAGNFFAPLRYSFPASQLIHDLKFRARIEIAGYLGSRLGQAVTKHGFALPQRLIPVPLHRSRVAERGYNQSLEIARVTGAMLGIPVSYQHCHRIVNTPAQTTVLATERARNLRGAFAVAGYPLPEHVAVIDDVITTGATAKELALVLHRNGVQRTDIWATARTVFPG